MSNKQQLQNVVKNLAKAGQEAKERTAKAVEQVERVRQVQTEQPNR